MRDDDDEQLIWKILLTYHFPPSLQKKQGKNVQPFLKKREKIRYVE